MSPELAHLTALLRTIFDLGAEDDRGSPPPPSDWHRWAALVESNRLSPLLGNRLSAGMRITGMPEALARELAAAAAEEAREAAVREVALAGLRATLRAAGLDWIELKGVAVAADLYAARCERAMTDADLLLPSPEACLAAGESLAGAGFRIARDMPGHHHLAPLRDHSTLLAVELHHNLTAPPLSPAHLETLWARRVPAGEGWRFDDPARLLHHALHIANDPVDTPLLRNLVECGALAARLGAEAWEDLERLAEQVGRRGILDEVMSLASELTGCPGMKAAPSPLTFWMRRRLEWHGHPTRLGRGAPGGEGTGDLAHAEGRLPPAWIGAPAALCSVLTLRGRKTGAGRQPLRAGLSVGAGSATLVHRTDTGRCICSPAGGDRLDHRPAGGDPG
ncbi:MAG: nucleotidyltransferase family protein [Kiritimatiellia bacterium]